MGLFQKKPPIEKEWEKLTKQESHFLASRAEQKESFINRKLAEIVPEKLQGTLDAAFFKAFELIFDKGTGLIEKTYDKEELEKSYKINEYAESVRQDMKSLKAFSKKAKKSGNLNLLISGASGIGMGVLGIGIPDIPVFIGMVLKSVYEIALNFGFQYDTPDEQYLILLMIQGAVSHGDAMLKINEKIDSYFETGVFGENCDRKEQIERTSASLSKELLYMKFLQGVPVVGVVGGAYDAVYMKQIAEYANLKYKRRFLMGKRNR